MEEPPDLRLMLVGHDWVKNNKVGNTLLGKQVFETEDQSSPMKSHNAVSTGYVHYKYITVASPADLFASDLSESTLRQRVKECTSLCHPGPQALVLVVDTSEFGEQQRWRMECIMDFFSDQAQNHAIVFINKGDIVPEDMVVDIRNCKNKDTEMIIHSCGESHHMYTRCQNKALKAIEEMVSKNDYSALSYEDFQDARTDSYYCPRPLHSPPRSSMAAVTGKLPGL
ncbi:GTPase IMAP family member 5-like [Engraulis encrasicolus]|uniref:GTPase IMAP family member 5-like n=1 Tax=Engraulis encrasicolus TaxID=184585 RepID=UPI002FD48CB4